MTEIPQTELPPEQIKALKEVWDTRRKEIVDLGTTQIATYGRTILTLSTAGMAFTMALVSHESFHSTPESRGLLQTAWVLWSIACLCVAWSCLLYNIAQQLHLKQANRQLGVLRTKIRKEEWSNRNLELFKKRFGKTILSFNLISILFFSLGLLSTMAFGVTNSKSIFGETRQSIPKLTKAITSLENRVINLEKLTIDKGSLKLSPDKELGALLSSHDGVNSEK